MRFFYPLLFVLLISSCNNSAEKKADKTISYDSVQVSTYSVFDAQAFKSLKLPLKIDTLFIQGVDTSNMITFQQLRSLKSSFMFSEFPSSPEYDINTFCMIDSLRHHGKYNNYLDKLDIGMTKTSIAFKLGVVELRESLKLFIWGIAESSDEACPFFSGTTIIGTFVNTNKESIHVVLGMISCGGDPPAMGSEEITSKITDNKIFISGKSISDDLDVPGEETTIQSVIIELSDTMKFLSPFKKVSNTEEVKE